MKKYVVQPNVKGIDALALKEATAKKPGPGEVCVRVHAAAINYRDLITVKRGVSQELIPFSDGAGVVEATGEGVNGLKKGDKVLGLFFPLWQGGKIDAHRFRQARGGVPTDGMLTQHVCGHESGFVKFPRYLSYEEASTLPCAGLTAWNAMMVQGGLQPGETVVIQGTGGVALFSLQFAKAAGAKAIVLSSRSDKLRKAKEMGADILINYQENPEWDKVVMEKTDGQGADLVIELGGSGTLERSMSAAKISGRISMIGVLTGVSGQVNPMPVIRKCLSINGIYVGSGDMQKQMHAAMKVNQIHPVIDRIFTFEQAKEAFAYLESAMHFGKIVVRIDG
jgi:NADPH:quinone reductase-like Zn-dependent oxidoreductase